MDSLLVEKEDHGRAIGGLVRERLGVSRSLLRRIKREGSIILNGEPVTAVTRVKEGDTITLEMELGRQSDIIPDDGLLDIVYEDSCLMVVNKSAGMLVHPVAGERAGTLANSVLGHWLKKGKANPVFRPVYRIDRDTSGLVLVSGSHLAHLALERQLRAKTMRRVYIAVAGGKIAEERGTIDCPIARKPGSIVEREVSPGGKPAVTHYRVIKRLPAVGATVLEVTLETGRTHQIRVHMSHLGHPLLGDTLYGGDRIHIERHALHSYRLVFTHPASGRLVDLTGALPDDMKKLLDNP